MKHHSFILILFCTFCLVHSLRLKESSSNELAENTEVFDRPDHDDHEDHDDRDDHDNATTTTTTSDDADPLPASNFADNDGALPADNIADIILPPSDPTGVVVGRIQYRYTDTDDFQCLARRRNDNVTFLTLATCAYDGNQMFTYDMNTKRLTTQGDVGSRYAAISWTPGPLANSHRGMSPIVLRTMSEPGSFQKWTIPFSDFAGILIESTDDPSAMCVQVGTDDANPIVSAAAVAGDRAGSRCSWFKFMRAEDDFLAGRIRYTSDDNPDQLSCVTFDPTAVPPRSALYTAPCREKLTTQRFVYNFISKHLRTAYNVAPPTTPMNQSALFFWWNGPIKQYPQIESTDQGYGWNLPMMRSGDVIMNDGRYYSGKCWQVLPDNQIVANQTCGSFVFDPERVTFFVKGTAPSTRQYLAVQITTPATASSSEKCARVLRTPDITGTGYQYQVQMRGCDYNQRIDQRFVLSQLAGAACNTTSCVGYIRWSGEPSILMSPRQALSFNWDTKYMVFFPLLEDAVPFVFNFPFNRTGPILITARGRTGCISVSQNNLFYVTLETSRCVNFRVRPAPTSVPGFDADQSRVMVAARFDRRAQLLLLNPQDPTAADYDHLKEKAQQGGMDDDTRQRFKRCFDPFVADLGITGMRRYFYSGPGAHMRVTGDLIANDDARRNGIGFPLFPLGAMRDVRYMMVDFYFHVMPSNLQSLPQQNNSYVLMSFARTSGCVLYLTFQGHIGIRCYRTGVELVSGQVLTWPTGTFSLLDGRPHKVSLLYSTRGGDEIRVTVDGMVVLSLTAPLSTAIGSISRSINFFNDPYFWQYGRLPAALSRVSILGSDSLSSLTSQATNLLFNVQPMPGSLSNLARVAGLSTKWTRCVFARRVGVPVVYESMTCRLTAVDASNNVVTVPMDVFSLGCSRPMCEIFFPAGQSSVANQFTFVYKPSFPTTFTSEDVGDPALWMDMAFVTDGFKQITVGFGIRYARSGSARLEVAVEYADTARYVAVQSCCGTIANRVCNRDDDLQNDTF